jgi:hypothetical protein
VICAYTRKGRGVIAGFSDSSLFYGASMGNESVIPSPQQRQIGTLEFALMRFLAEDRKFSF